MTPDARAPAPPRVAVLGCGAWGANLARNLRDLGALAACVDPSAPARATAASLAPAALVTADLARVLADASIDAVAIAAPSELHARLTREALLAGKDVFCEKPLALTYDDARAGVELARERGRVLMVGHILEHHPAIRALVELLRRGELGELLYVFSNRLNLGKVAREENILWSFAPHDIALVLRLAGAMPTRVTATGGAYLKHGVADVTVTTLAFPNGVGAHIFVSWLNPFKEQKLVVIGSAKMATFDDVAKELVLHDQRVDWREGEPVPLRGPGVRVPYSLEEPLRLEMQAFCEAVRSRATPLADGASALPVLRIIEAAEASLLAGGAPIAVPPEP